MVRTLRRIAIGLSAAALGGLLVVAPTFAATPTATYEAVAGHAKTYAAAVALKHKLAVHKLTGFVIERDAKSGKTVYEVERPYKTRAAAVAEVAKIRAAGFRHAGVETDK
jgi:hypothetical protein